MHDFVFASNFPLSSSVRSVPPRIRNKISLCEEPIVVRVGLTQIARIPCQRKTVDEIVCLYIYSGIRWVGEDLVSDCSSPQLQPVSEYYGALNKPYNSQSSIECVLTSKGASIDPMEHLVDKYSGTTTICILIGGARQTYTLIRYEIHLYIIGVEKKGTQEHLLCIRVKRKRSRYKVSRIRGVVGTAGSLSTNCSKN